MKEAISQDTIFNVETGEGTLPHGIVLTQGSETSLARSFTLRHITGVEEDILADNRRGEGGKGKPLVSGADRVTSVLARCTISIGEKHRIENLDPESADPKFFNKMWERATMGDRSFALNCLRRKTLGDQYKFNHTCPECAQEIRNIRVDLNTLDVFPPFRNIKETEEFPKDAVDKAREEAALREEQDVVLPVSKSRCKVRLLRGSDEDRYVTEMTENKSEQPTTNLLYRVVSINDAPVTKKMLKNLPGADRRFLTNFCDEIEGGLDSEIVLVCDNADCGHKFTAHIDFGNKNFFFPSET